MIQYQCVWKGPVRKASGLGIASREYFRALKRRGVDIRTEPQTNGSPGGRKTNKRRVLIYHFFPYMINIQKERKHFDHIILNTVWETTKIPNRWRPNINKFDAICVPSVQNRQALRNSGVKVPIFIVPHGVDTRKYHPGNKKMPLPGSQGKFIFVSVFGFQHRKNPEALLRAFWEEFSPADKVMLVIKTSGTGLFENEQWILNRIKRYKKKLGIRKQTAPVKVIARHLSPERLKGVYTLGHAFVLPTRGEGVGLPFLESLSSGVPVIATGWGGHMDFLTRKNSFLINYKLMNPVVKMRGGQSIAYQFRKFFAEKGQRWAEVDIASLKRQMRTAYRNPALCRQKGRQGRLDVSKLSWGRAGLSLKRVVEKVVASKK